MSTPTPARDDSDEEGEGGAGRVEEGTVEPIKDDKIVAEKKCVGASYTIMAMTKGNPKPHPTVVRVVKADHTICHVAVSRSSLAGLRYTLSDDGAALLVSGGEYPKGGKTRTVIGGSITVPLTSLDDATSNSIVLGRDAIQDTTLPSAGTAVDSHSMQTPVPMHKPDYMKGDPLPSVDYIRPEPVASDLPVRTGPMGELPKLRPHTINHEALRVHEQRVRDKDAQAALHDAGVDARATIERVIGGGRTLDILFGDVETSASETVERLRGIIKQGKGALRGRRARSSSKILEAAQKALSMLENRSKLEADIANMLCVIASADSDPAVRSAADAYAAKHGPTSENGALPALFNYMGTAQYAREELVSNDELFGWISEPGSKPYGVEEVERARVWLGNTYTTTWELFVGMAHDTPAGAPLSGLREPPSADWMSKGYADCTAISDAINGGDPINLLNHAGVNGVWHPTASHIANAYEAMRTRVPDKSSPEANERAHTITSLAEHLGPSLLAMLGYVHVEGGAEDEYMLGTIDASAAAKTVMEGLRESGIPRQIGPGSDGGDAEMHKFTRMMHWSAKKIGLMNSSGRIYLPQILRGLLVLVMMMLVMSYAESGFTGKHTAGISSAMRNASIVNTRGETDMTISTCAWDIVVGSTTPIQDLHYRPLYMPISSPESIVNMYKNMTKDSVTGLDHLLRVLDTEVTMRDWTPENMPNFAIARAIIEYAKDPDINPRATRTTDLLNAVAGGDKYVEDDMWTNNLLQIIGSIILNPEVSMMDHVSGVSSGGKTLKKPFLGAFGTTADTMAVMRRDLYKQVFTWSFAPLFDPGLIVRTIRWAVASYQASAVEAVTVAAGMNHYAFEVVTRILISMISAAIIAQMSVLISRSAILESVVVLPVVIKVADCTTLLGPAVGAVSNAIVPGIKSTVVASTGGTLLARFIPRAADIVFGTVGYSSQLIGALIQAGIGAALVDDIWTRTQVMCAENNIAVDVVAVAVAGLATTMAFTFIESGALATCMPSASILRLFVLDAPGGVASAYVKAIKRVARLDILGASAALNTIPSYALAAISRNANKLSWLPSPRQTVSAVLAVGGGDVTMKVARTVLGADGDNSMFIMRGVAILTASLGFANVSSTGLITVGAMLAGASLTGTARIWHGLKQQEAIVAALDDAARAGKRRLLQLGVHGGMSDPGTAVIVDEEIKRVLRTHLPALTGAFGQYITHHALDVQPLPLDIA